VIVPAFGRRNQAVVNSSPWLQSYADARKVSLNVVVNEAVAHYGRLIAREAVLQRIAAFRELSPSRASISLTLSRSSRSCAGNVARIWLGDRPMTPGLSRTPDPGMEGPIRESLRGCELPAPAGNPSAGECHA